VHDYDKGSCKYQKSFEKEYTMPYALGMMFRIKRALSRYRDVPGKVHSKILNFCLGLQSAPINSGSEQKAVIHDPHALGRVDLSALEPVLEVLRRRCVQGSSRDLPMSAFVINHNEHPTLELSLLSLWPCCELVVVDKGSTDASVSYIDRYATQSLKAAWSPIVEDTRAMADAACSYKWRIFLDGDEFLTPETITFLREILVEDERSNFPYDAIALPRINHIFGQKAERNLYQAAPLVRVYRKGMYHHVKATHRVALDPSARIFTPRPETGAAIIHFNQDNIFEYLEKMNRYTETYVTRYPTPQTADDIYHFAIRKVVSAYLETRRRQGTTHDAVCDLITAFYYSIEYLKQWESDNNRSVGDYYATMVRRYFDIS
jgi:hypothetical protein